MQILARTLLPLLLTVPAAATDYWVDPLAGNDAHSGLAPAEAWATATHALAAIPDGEHVLHLLPGTYSAAGGEVFPLPVRTGIAIRGEGGSAATILEGGFEAMGFASTYYLDARGLTLRGGTHGILIYRWHLYQARLNLEDIVIEDTTGHGIHADSYAPDSSGKSDADFEAVLVDVRVTRCGGRGLWVGASSFHAEATSEVLAVRCEFSYNADWGGRAAVGSSHCCGDTYVKLEQCRIVGNGAGGFTSPSGEWDSARIDMDTCLVADNLGPGLVSPGGTIRHCTFTGNLLGLQGTGALRETILWGNEDDVRDFLGNMQYCCVDDPDAPAGPGNLALDPRFVDPAAGDWRLAFDSPCIDAGDPAWPADSTDVAGVPRPVDGDLDRDPRDDIGAHEFAPLAWRGDPTPGGTLYLELWGPAGGSERLYWKRGGLAAPRPTLFGTWHLGEGPVRVLASAPTAPGPPAFLPLLLPDSPLLVGQSFAFQGLTSAVPGGPAALTNPIRIDVAP